MNEEDKIHINSFKFYDRDELEELTKQYYLENKQLKRSNLAMQEEMARTWAKLDKKEDIINKIRELIDELYLTNDDKCYDIYKNILNILDNKGE